MSEDELSDTQFLDQLVDFLGWRRAARVVGWCVLVSALGPQRLSEHADAPDRVTNWRTLRDVRRFHEFLARRDNREQPSDVEFLVQRVGRLIRKRRGEVHQL